MTDTATNGYKLRAQADDGRELHVHVPKFVAWVMSLASVALIAGVAMLIDLNLRVSVIESNRFTAADAQELVDRIVPRAEYEAREENMNARLERMEAKIDQLLERN